MELYDNEASIKITTAQGDKLLIKKEITEVQLINNAVFKLGSIDPLRHVFIRYSEVTIPETADVMELYGLILEWMENCGCLYQEPPAA